MYDVVMKEEVATAMVPVGDESYQLSAKVHSRETITSLQSLRITFNSKTMILN